jgi:hypothetical protein
MKMPFLLFILLNKLNGAGCGPVRKQGDEYRCCCPAHADNGPSLYVGLGDGTILVHCGAGCTAQEVCDRLDHDVADLFFDPDDEGVDTPAGLGIFEAGAELDAAPPKGEGADGKAPDLDQRHDMYSDLLGRLELSSAHFNALRKRGLSPTEIDNRGYRTADSVMISKAVDALLGKYERVKVLLVPGFVEKYDRVIFNASRGYLIPARSLGGKIVALKIRHDAGYTGPKYTWASTKNATCGNVVHVPLGVSAPRETVRLTEGELKADIATALSGIPTISAPGVGNWRLALPVIKQLEAKKVLLAMDQDGRPGTLAAVEQALYGLTREEFDVAVEWWDGQAAKGIDDLLAAGRQPEVLTGLAAALRVRDALAPPGPPQDEEAEPEPPPFPLEVFPPALADYCRQVGESTGTPPDFSAMTMLVTAGAAIGNSRALCLKANIWYECPRFYAANVGHPASGKTPAMEAVVKPYQTIQHKLIKAHKDAQATYAAAKQHHDQIVKENKALPKGAEQQPLPSVPAEPAPPERLVVNDATVEALAPLLQGNPRGLLMLQDEGVGWVRSMGQYKGGRGNDRQFWLSTWSGKSHIVDRKYQDGVPISIPRPYVNVICGLQPDMLGELADSQGRSDGFIDRVLFVFPPAPPGADWTDSTVTPTSKQAWETALSRLRMLAMEELEDGVLGYRVVNFSPAAREAWIAWWDAHAAEIRGPDLSVQLIGPWGKLKAYAARLALVLHYLWQVQGDGHENNLEEASVERAVRLLNYFKGQSRLVYSRLPQTPEDNRLYEVVDWIRRNGRRCRARDLVRARKASPTPKAKKLLAELQDRGYGRLEYHEGANGRQVQWFIYEPN